MDGKVHIHSHGLDYSSREEVVVGDGGGSGGGQETTKVLWAELNAQHALPQFAAASNSTANFAAQHVKQSKRWQKLRHQSAANEYELAYNHTEEHLEKYAGLESSAFLTATLKQQNAENSIKHRKRPSLHVTRRKPFTRASLLSDNAAVLGVAGIHSASESASSSGGAGDPGDAHGTDGGDGGASTTTAAAATAGVAARAGTSDTDHINVHRHHSSKPPSVPLTAFLGQRRTRRSPTTKKAPGQRRSQTAINDDAKLKPEKSRYSAELEFWREHGAPSKGSGARVREVCATMKLYPKKIGIQRQCLRRILAAVKEATTATTQQLRAQAAVDHLVAVLLGLSGDGADEVHALALELLVWVVTLSSPPDLAALFYSEAVGGTAHRSFLGGLAEYLGTVKPDDPKVCALVAAIVHAWLGALDVSLHNDWGGEVLLPGDAGPTAAAGAKAVVLRRLRHDAAAVRTQLGRCAQRYGHACSPAPERVKHHRRSRSASGGGAGGGSGSVGGAGDSRDNGDEGGGSSDF